jgi:tripartite-type tricarboxylate transporter receptor subunit TctC
MIRHGLIGALALGLSVIAEPAAAQTWPAKPITVLVPFPAGGTTDVLARVVTAKMAAALKTSFVIDNHGGAGGTIGSALAARAPADGYTLVMSNIASFAVGPTLYGRLPYDPLRDFSHIGMIAPIPSVLVVDLRTAIRSLGDYIAAARRDPGGLNFATGGNGSSAHVQGELFKRLAGIDIVHVPYRGSALALNDVVAGQVASMITVVANANTMRGQVRPLAITTPARVAALPDVPTFTELGFPDLVAFTWFGLSAPAGLDDAIADRLNAALIDAVNDPEVAARFAEFAVAPNRMTRQDYTRYIAAELARWKPIIEESGARPD